MLNTIRKFLFQDLSCERLGVILAGVSRVGDTVKLLGREFIPAGGEDIAHESRGRVESHGRFSQRIMERCAATGLHQLDVHSHPFGGSAVHFSGIDDVHESELAAYIFERLPGTMYGSIVMDGEAIQARMWVPGRCGPAVCQVERLTAVEFPLNPIELERTRTEEGESAKWNNQIYDRQVRAFGLDGQRRLATATVAVVGNGGLGSIVVEGLARLGVGSFSLIDPDQADPTNANRVVGMTAVDAEERTPKAEIAGRMVKSINPSARVTEFTGSVFDTEALPIMRVADVLVVATDDHSTRLFVQRVGVQYLIPVVSLGVNIDVQDGRLSDVSGEFSVSLPGPAGWCALCARTIDPQIAAWELAEPADQERWVQRGYVTGANVPSPSVRHLNGVVADLALGEIHNLFTGFKRFESFVSYNQLSTELMSITVQRDKDCALCGEGALLGLGDLEPMPEYLRHRKCAVRVPKAPVAESLDEIESGDSIERVVVADVSNDAGDDAKA